MELGRRNGGLLHWILDHKHFLLFSFFTKRELEQSLAHVSRRFNEKTMSVLLWREMVLQIAGANVNEGETVAEENSALEDEKLEDLLQSCEIVDRDDKPLPSVEEVSPHHTHRTKLFLRIRRTHEGSFLKSLVCLASTSG